jgi:hypothetical protein
MGRGLSGSINRINGDWIAEAPMGKVKVAFAQKNEFGVLDHDVMFESGAKFYNPMRVFPNDDAVNWVLHCIASPAYQIRNLPKMPS